jgi:hypothetical protein
LTLPLNLFRLSWKELRRLVVERKAPMSQEMQGTIQEALHRLQQSGFQECTPAASRHDDTPYLCAFERQDDEEQVYYCCVTDDDLWVLVSLAEASAWL